MKNNIQGVGVALVTPFTVSDQVDYDALGRLVEHVSQGGVDYLVALGTTAETPTLTCQEKCDVVNFIKQKNRECKNLPLVVGIGGNCTKAVIESIKSCDLDGVDAILSVVPYYNKPTQRGLYEHFKAIALESPKPILLYNVPSRTGVSMCVETTLKLAREFDNIIGVKEASDSIDIMNELLSGRPNRDFKVISGDDSLALELKDAGGDGVISVIANVIPETLCQMFATQSKDKAIEINEGMKPLVIELFAEGNPTGIKLALSIKEITSDAVRLPLVSASEELKTKMCELFNT